MADDLFLDAVARVKIEELRTLLDSKLINQKDAAARFHALSLALNPDTTDLELYYALVERDFHPELVAVAKETGKGCVVDAFNALKLARNLRYTALAYAAKHGQLEVMKLLKTWGSTDYNAAFIAAAGGGHVEAMKLLKTWGAKDYDKALEAAAFTGQVDAMEVLIAWGAYDCAAALSKALEGGRMDSMRR